MIITFWKMERVSQALHMFTTIMGFEKNERKKEIKKERKKEKKEKGPDGPFNNLPIFMKWF